MIKYLTIFAVDVLDRLIHQRNILKFIKNLPSQIDVVLDVGCHNGEYAVLFKKAFLGTTVYGFEPNVSLIKKISQNKKLKENFEIINAAVTDNDEYVDMIIDTEISKISTAAKINYDSKTFLLKKYLYQSNKEKDVKNTIKVKSISLDKFLSDKGIDADFVKIDVEGFEINVLNGFKNKIKKTKYVMIEHHNDDLYLDIDKAAAHDFLLNNNFKLIKSIKFPFMDWEDRIYENIN